MYSTADSSKVGSSSTLGVQLIEKAQGFNEDDDLLSPFDTGDVERQMKRAWWKTCSLFTFLLATVGVILFIVVRDNNVGHSAVHNKDVRIRSNYVVPSVAIEAEESEVSVPSKPIVNIGPHVTLHELSETSVGECAKSIMDSMIENGDFGDDSLTIMEIENAFFHVLDEFGSISIKTGSSLKNYINKVSGLGIISKKINKEFEINTLRINADSDAIDFTISINWESIFGNKLPYTTEKTVTMMYDSNQCEITDLEPREFEECFNGDCREATVSDSVVVKYLKELLLSNIHN